MENRSLYRFYTLGWDFNEMKTSGFKGQQVNEVIRVLNNFLEFLRQNNMDVTTKAIGSDLTVIIELLNLQKSEDTILEENSNRIRSFAKSIEKTLDAELSLRRAFVLTEKRLGLPKLLNHVNEMFEKGTFEKLSDIAKFDLQEAGKCLAFERYTASAFHILRATEEMLRVYYKTKVKKGRPLHLLWAPMVTDLGKKKGISKSLLAVLDNVRIDFRNPTDHPEKTYSEEEVQNLFTHCIDIITRIIKELKI